VAHAALGCSLLVPVERSYLSNQEQMEGAASIAGYELSGDAFRLTAVDLRDDSATFQYRGVEHPGDTAWVVCFSEKSSEQAPERLLEINSVLPLLAESREGFEVIEFGVHGVTADTPARWARYRFDSPVRAANGKPLEAHGIVVSLRRESSGTALVWQVKLDNHGDREVVRWEDVEPLVAACLQP
jgi:hypothetical protein